MLWKVKSRNAALADRWELEIGSLMAEKITGKMIMWSFVCRRYLHRNCLLFNNREESKILHETLAREVIEDVKRRLYSMLEVEYDHGNAVLDKNKWWKRICTPYIIS